MNKYIKLLVENSFNPFDDEIFTSIVDMSAEEEFSLNMFDINMSKAISIIRQITTKNENSWASNVLTIPENDIIKYEIIDGSTVYFYYVHDNKKILIELLEFINQEDTTLITEFLNAILNCGFITHVYSTIIYRESNSHKVYNYENSKKNVIDFYGLTFKDVNISLANVKNLNVDFNFFKKIKIDINCSTNYNRYEDFSYFGYCILDNTTINSVYRILFSECYQIKDFSFIKNINNRFCYLIYSYDSFPECRSFLNLPNGAYTFELTLNINYDCIEDKEDKVLSLKGISELMKVINVNVRDYPDYVLSHFSFEGITEKMIKSTFNFSCGGFRNKKVNIQLGPYKLHIVRKRFWKPTIPQYLGIIKAQDWFLDAYLDKNEPHKEYIPSESSNSDVIEKIKAKEQKKAEKNQLQKDDEAEDLQLMIDIIKKTFKPGDKLFYEGNGFYLEILELKEHILRLARFRNFLHRFDFSKTYKDFIKDYVLNLNIKTKDGINLWEVIGIPVIERRAKIKKRRKREEKKQKELEKLNKKAKQTLQTSQPTTNLTTTNNSDVEIIDYSERAIAIFGNTYTIKDKLKELGGKYNPRLKYDSTTVKPGWVLSKRKQQELQNYLNTL